MLQEIGRIVAVESDAVWVEAIQQSTCGSCAAKKGCGQSLLSSLGVKPVYMRVLLEGRASTDYHVDDSITIGIPNDVVLKSSLFIYLAPLLLMIVFAGVAHTMINNEGLSIFSGVFGLVVGGGLIRYHSVIAKDDPRFQPVLIDNRQAIIIQNPNVREV